jgi:membrane protein DedA with SNARE-associated domain/DNA-binding transcriptional ArsR family regulator
VALALLAGLLFAEEAGVPLPFAPGELTLLAAGLLISAGGLDPWVFAPVAVVACVGGSLVGYYWARALGDRGLEALARRLHQQRALERVTLRVRSAGWMGVAVTRLIPGLRIYTTLVAGALRVKRSTFLTGMITATVLWVAVYVALGMAAGVPIEHFLTQVQRLAVQGGILVAMGVGCYLAVRRTPASSGAGLVRLPRVARIVVAAAVDVGVVACVSTGLLALGRLLGVGFRAGWVDALVALLVVAAFYVIIARRSGGATVGEALLHTSYAIEHRPGLRAHSPLETVRAFVSGNRDELTASSELLRALGDPERLRIVSQLLEKPLTLAEMASSMQQLPFELRHQLDRLTAAGVLTVSGEEPDAVYAVRPEIARALVQLLAAIPPAPAHGTGPHDDPAGAAGDQQQAGRPQVAG